MAAFFFGVLRPYASQQPAGVCCESPAYLLYAELSFVNHLNKDLSIPFFLAMYRMQVFRTFNS